MTREVIVAKERAQKEEAMLLKNADRSRGSVANQEWAESRFLKEEKEDKKKGDEFRGIEFFEDILDRIGSRGGKFQKKLNALVGLCAFMAVLAATNHVYATYVPHHWCHVPGRELTNLTLEEWKNLTLPSVNGSLSQCEMLSGNECESVVPCQHGWEFDNRWFSVTIPVEQKWICDQRLRMHNALAISGVICTFLVVFMCYSGDRFGRKLQYALSFSLLAAGRTISAFSPPIYGLYIAALGVASAGIASAYECVIAMGLEMSSVDSRNTVNSLGIVVCTISKISCALIAWHLPHYLHLLLATSLPLFIPLFFVCWIPESPRWLTGKGRNREAFQVLQRIARLNGKQLPQEAMETLHKMSKRKNVQFGVISLATNRSLRRNTLIIVLSRFVTMLTNASLSYNLGNVPMNPFLMQIAFSSIDVLAIFLSHFMSEKIGRRWSHCIFIFLSAVSCGVLILITAVSPSTIGMGCVTVILNMVNNCALFVSYLQSMEIHPTCVRQSAGAVEMFSMTMAMTLAPYVVHLHVVSGGLALYGIVGALQLVTTVVVSFLPETLNQKLPETLEDADKFGALARYWSFPSGKDGDQHQETTSNGKRV